MRVSALILLLVLATPCCGQRSLFPGIRTLLAKKDCTNALPLVTAAALHIETKNDPETWFLRGLCYLVQASEDTATSGPAAEEAYLSFKRTLELNPDYNKEIDAPLHATAILKFNTAVSLYAATFYGQAYKEFMSVNEMYTAGRQHTAGNKEFTSLDADARKNAAYSAINAGHDNDAIPLLEELIKKGAKDDPTTYLSLIEIYQATKNEQKLVATIKEAKKQFPDNKLFLDAERDYQQRQQQLLPRLEEMARKEPDNPEVQNSLGNIYLKQAFPKDQRGRQFVIQPLNLKEIFTKAEKAYSKAIQLAPSNANYYYNFGLLYYNYGRLITSRMEPLNKDRGQYEELDKRRMKEFNHSLTYFEKSYSLLTQRSNDLSAQEKTTYQNLLQMLSQVYQLNGNKQKLEEMNAAIMKWK